MRLKSNDFFLYGMLFCIFFWDILEDIFPKSPLILLLGLFLLFIFKRGKIEFRKSALCLFIFLFAHGIINTILGNDSLYLIATQIGSICLCFLIFDNFTKNYKIERIISVYWNFAVLTSIIGIIEQIGAILNLRVLVKVPLLFDYTKFDYRVVGFAKLASICREPSFLGYLLAPSVCLIISYVFAPEFVNRKMSIFKNKIAMVIVMLAYIFTFSGVAYFGMAIMCLGLWYKKGVSIKKIVIPFFLRAIAFCAYLYIPDIHIRIDDTISVFTNDNVDTASLNLSTYTYYSNYTVTKRTFKETVGFGSGIGSYRIMFDRYNPGEWGNSGLALNREDANSGFFRISSELGILGIILVVLYIFKFFPKGKNDSVAFSIAFLSLISMFLLRQGNYIHGGSIMFIWLYYINYNQNFKLMRK